MFAVQDIETLGHSAVFLLIFSFFFILGVLAFLLWVGWWVSHYRGSLSPYSKKPMRLGVDVAPTVVKFVDAFLLSHEQPDNRPFEFAVAAVCQETGRIFPNCVKRREIIRLDWTFLRNRCPGNYVSWGSLSELEQATIRLCHESMHGFQTEFSSPRAMPQEIDEFFAMKKPGPLYVDRVTKVLLGWKEVPGTEFEVLIVQKPIYQSIEETL